MANTMARKRVTREDTTLDTAVMATPTAPPTPDTTRLTALVMVFFQSMSDAGSFRFAAASHWLI